MTDPQSSPSSFRPPLATRVRRFLSGRSDNRMAAFGFAVLVSLLGLVATALLRPLLQVAVLPPLIAASLVAAWCGGEGPGLLAVFLSTVGASSLLFEPVGSFSLADPRDIAEVVIFMTVSVAVVLMTANLRRTRDRVEQHSRDLETALKEMEEFSYAMAHNLRGPLRSMAGFGELVREEQRARLDDAGREYVDRIISSSKLMDDLLQGLLTYAAVARARIEPKPVDVNAVLGIVLGGLAGEIERRGARIVRDQELPPVTAQADLLRQALAQLVLNAITFVRPGSPPVVRISAEASKGWTRIRIEDNGIGIEPAYVGRIFGLFERLSPESYPGTGIGLAIARRAIERMGGRIGVDSEPGKGSRFWIELPSSPQGSG